MKKKNREKAAYVTPKKFWCGVCDCSLVSAGSKCKFCHSRDKNKVAKAGNYRRALNSEPDEE